MSKPGFNSVVAGRTRAAEQILRDPELLRQFVEIGGLPRDLEAIKLAGEEAEAANLAQSISQSDSKAATLDILMSFASTQKEYAAVMSVLRAVCSELERNGGDVELITKLTSILTNEAELSVKVTTDESGAKTRRVNRALSQEALRAEMAKDARALLALEGAHAALAERLVTKERLSALLGSAEALAGKLANRAAAKGEKSASTKAEQDASARQREVWGGTYRLLSTLGARDARVGSLLAETTAR